MAKSIGYILALVGVAIIVLSSKISAMSFLKSLPKASIYTVLVGVIFVVAGIFFVMDKSVGKSEAEVPVYDKTGKRVVGYRRMK